MLFQYFDMATQKGLHCRFMALLTCWLLWVIDPLEFANYQNFEFSSKTDSCQHYHPIFLNSARPCHLVWLIFFLMLISQYVRILVERQASSANQHVKIRMDQHKYIMHDIYKGRGVFGRTDVLIKQDWIANTHFPHPLSENHTFF